MYMFKNVLCFLDHLPQPETKGEGRYQSVLLVHRVTTNTDGFEKATYFHSMEGHIRKKIC